MLVTRPTGTPRTATALLPYRPGAPEKWAVMVVDDEVSRRAINATATRIITAVAAVRARTS
jgi:hypothetical protein